ncbi:MAG TPA: phosphoglucosamine mutase [Pyrinomonadaceae bacterium]|nr:phosphoglucosamine mutase [Pyrinomonadaceae bacterium]
MKPENISRLFGTDGIRGEAGKFPLDPETVRVIGRSLAIHLAERTGRKPAIVTGRDTRESGSWIEREFIAGARVAGADVQSAEIITTPGIAFLARDLPADAGVVISASHNPYQDNGIKVFEPSGRKLDEATERIIENDIAESSLNAGPLTSNHAAEPVVVEKHAAELRLRYLSYLQHDVAHNLSLRGFTMVVDCANGAAYELAPELFGRLGARVIAINNEPDGRNINRECGSLHIEGLQSRVVKERADLGVAFDGDADRALFVDAKGNFVDGDATMWVMADDLRARGELIGDVVVATVMSNIGLEIALRSRGIVLTRADVGDKYVLEELMRSGAIMGGEQSGHIIFPRLSLAGDGLITTINLLRAMRSHNKNLEELVGGFQRYPQVLVNVRVREKKPFQTLPAIQQLAEEIKQKLGSSGRLLLRYSGTEPLARVMIEGENESEVNSLANALAQVIKAELGSNES